MADDARAAQQRPEIPDRVFFRIGEVSEIVGVDPHVLRYWEGKFPLLEPRKTSRGYRQYRRKDVETALAIKEMLHVRRYTIEGARKALHSQGKSASRSAAPSPPPASPDAFREIRTQLQQILDLLA